jgi:hypothetical protein
VSLKNHLKPIVLGTKRVSYDQTSVDIVAGVDINAEENLDEKREEVM